MTKSRLEAFSDGVLAIAITLLVIEIHPPELHQGQRLAQALWAQWPSYLAYLVSFLTIGVIWLNHHRLFEQVAWVTRDARLLHRPPPPGVVRGPACGSRSDWASTRSRWPCRGCRRRSRWGCVG
jgi:Endosomal/lysosomal potassium channel TMEM175